MQLKYLDSSPTRNMNITLILNCEESASSDTMDLQSVLNPRDEDDQDTEQMVIDSSTSTSLFMNSPSTTPSIIDHSMEYSPRSSPSIDTSQFPSPVSHYLDSNHLPSMNSLPNSLPIRSAARQPTAGSSQRLPPLRSILPELIPSSVDEKKPCAQYPKIEEHRSHHPSRVTVSRRAEQKLLRQFHQYELHAALLYEQGHRNRRRRSAPTRTKSKRQRKGPHNNKPYTREMIHWIRYHAVDRPRHYKDLVELFFEQFPCRRALATHQILTSRLYRDNDRPHLDADGKWGFVTSGKDKGKLRMVKSKVRQRQTKEGREVDYPYTLVDRWPQRVLEYEWLEPILEEDKERARRILAGDDPSDLFGKRANWRRILNECEKYIYKAEN